nr:hypothetical protein [Candidatus Njordarchaeota archaeon]
MKQSSSGSDMFPMVKPRLRYPDVEALRRGRGFSYGEISGAAVSVHDVKMAGLPMDRMRRSAHDFNVKALRELLGKTGRETGAQRSKARGGAKVSAGKRQERAEKKKSRDSKAGKKKDK